MDSPHEVVCHVCGIVHTIMCDFLSGSTRVMPDGRELVKHSCGKHSPDEVRAALEEDDKLPPPHDDWYCKHGYLEGRDCPDCDIPSYLPAVLS